MNFAVREIAAAETATAYTAMSALRTHLIDMDEFIRRVNDDQRPEGYRLAGVYRDDSAEAIAVAGFRVRHTLSFGHYLYVDDLSTVAQARRNGHARRLLDYLGNEAVRLGCTQMHLDSGVGPARADAHRLYLNAGMQISAHHFAKSMTQ